MPFLSPTMSQRACCTEDCAPGCGASSQPPRWTVSGSATAPRTGPDSCPAVNGSVVLADEPTGNLDTVTGAGITALLRELNAQGTTLVIITHDKDIAAACTRRIQIRDGRVTGDTNQERSYA